MVPDAYTVLFMPELIKLNLDQVEAHIQNGYKAMNQEGMRWTL
jgi:hypothetical protein